MPRSEAQFYSGLGRIEKFRIYISQQTKWQTESGGSNCENVFPGMHECLVKVSLCQHKCSSACYQAPSAGTPRRLTSQFSYHNRVATLWPAVITAASSNQPSRALIKPSGRKKKQAAGKEVTLDWCMCACLCCVYVLYYVLIRMRTRGFTLIIKKKKKR